jgi:hypothetical protein
MTIFVPIDRRAQLFFFFFSLYIFTSNLQNQVTSSEQLKSLVAFYIDCVTYETHPLLDAEVSIQPLLHSSLESIDDARETLMDIPAETIEEYNLQDTINDLDKVRWTASIFLFIIYGVKFFWFFFFGGGGVC